MLTKESVQYTIRIALHAFCLFSETTNIPLHPTTYLMSNPRTKLVTLQENYIRNMIPKKEQKKTALFEKSEFKGH